MIHKNKLQMSEITNLFMLLSISFLASNLSIRYVMIILSCCLMLFFDLRSKIKIKLFKDKEFFLPIILVIWSGISLVLSGYWTTGWPRYVLLIYQLIVSYHVANNAKNPKKLFGIYFIVLLCINIFSLIFLRNISMYVYDGEEVFRGLYYEKNTLGFNTVFGVPFFVELIRDANSINKKVLSCFGLIMSFLLILLSHSTTAILFFGVLLMTSLLSKKKIVKMFKMFPICILLFAVYLICYKSLISSFLNTFLINSIGKGLDFTGRSILWFFSLILISKRIVCGYGFNGFWSDQQRVTSAMNQFGYAAVGNHAHNGYLEILLSSGLVGALILFAIVMYIYRNLKDNKVLNKITNVEILFLWFILFGNFIYNNIFDLSISWSIIVILLVHVARARNENYHEACT